MDANAIGGVVNLRLREAPIGFHFDMLTQGSLNHQDRTWDNYRFWASVSNRFFDDKLGVFLQGNADRSNAVMIKLQPLMQPMNRDPMVRLLIVWTILHLMINKM